MPGMTRSRAAELANLLHSRKQSLYLGKDEGGNPLFASRKDHLLALGPPQKGKTSGLIIPSIAAHPGPVVVVSTRHDILPVVRESRTAIAESRGGRVVELAFGETSGLVPSASWSVTDGCSDWNTALDRARVIVTTDNAKPPDKFWPSSAIDLLSTALFTAALIGEDDRYVAAKIKSADITELYDWLVDKVGDDHTATHTLWRFLNPNAMAPETRQSIFVTTSSGPLQSFEYEPLDSGEAFSLTNFVQNWGTVFVTIPWFRSKVFESRVTAFLEAVVASWRTHSRGDTTLLLSLDEVANIAPIPTLPKMITTGGGDGVQLLLGMQEPSQAGRWGDEASVLLNSVSHVAIFEGLRADSYLTGLSNLKGTQVRNDREAHVLLETPGGPFFADHARLLKERAALDEACEGKAGQARMHAAFTVAMRLTKLRQKDGIRCRMEGEGELPKRVLMEIERYTAIREVPKRLPRLDIDSIVAGKPGGFFLWSAKYVGFRSYQGWYEDPFWLAILGARVRDR